MSKIRKPLLASLVLSTALLLSACTGAATPTATAVPKPTDPPKPTAVPPTAVPPTAAPTAVPPTAAPTAVPATATPVPKPTTAPPCGDKTKLSKSISMYNWSDYIADDILTAFEKECGVQVNIDNYDDNESMFAKFQAGGNPGYDIIVPSDYMVEKMIAAGLLLKIDYANVPNIGNIDPSHRNLYFDPKSEYSVAYFWGTTGIAYDTAKVKRDITSWKDLLEPAADIKGKIGMLMDQREALGAALRLKGYSANSTDAKQIDEAKNLLIAQKKDVKGYYSSVDNRANLVSGDVVIAMMYTGDAINAAAEKPTIKYVIPTDVSTVWQDNLAIPKGAKNKYTAEVFINYLLRADMAAKNANDRKFPTPNAEAIKQGLIDKDLMGNKAIYPDVAALGKKLEFLVRGDAKSQALYDKAWTEVGVE
ncbi:MAG: spermidine/putrescine ABC transporter substrate-binding protein [Thermoflexales bacterium]|nr:spermidine/putrescine ABC transporter substrate-binding protein [Thermoflexales bacterium]